MQLFTVATLVRRFILISLAFLWLIGNDARPADLGDTPSALFTNLAERLLQSQLNRSLTRIQVYPTNEYTTAVHRLLQVAANIVDTGTTGSTPSVFRPLFARDGSTVTICGYTNDNDAVSARSWFASSPDGIPMVLGAKKGLPNFNEFHFQTAVQFTRKLELVRPLTNSPPNQTNQMLLLSISNVLGLEIWNSYSRPFSNDFEVFATNILTVTLSNAADTYATSPPPFVAGVDFPVYAGTNTNWHFDSRFPSKILTVGGFIVPLYANTFLLPSSRYGPGGFNSMTNSFLPRSGEFPVPDWRLCISNRLTYIMSSQNLIVDAMTLSFRTNLNLTEISTSPNYNYIEPFAVAALWDTNRVADPANLSIPTVGIIRQLDISLGKTALSDSDWRAFNAEVNDKTSSIQSFRSFVNSFSSSNLSQQAPFTATRRFLHLIKWQANDPLVHYLMEDLNDITNNASIRFLKPRDLDAFTNNLGRLNERYRPWLGNPLLESVGFPDVGIQDAGVFQSDDWNFPTNLLAAPGLLGRVHRGTPWQTIYLKARAISSDHWLNQSSDLRTHPTNDWKIATLFISLLNTNAPTRLLSVNQSNQSAWGAILNGLTVLSNTTPTLYRTAPTNFDFLTIDPGSPQVQIIVDGINHTRAASPFGYFPEIGDVLATPELTVASPWLDLSAEVQLLYSLTDEVYEKIPEQLLPLLRPDPILRVRRIDDALHFQALVFAGYLYVLETSTDLGHWTQLDTQFADGETVDFPDPIGLTDNQQFFRVRLMTQ